MRRTIACVGFFFCLSISVAAQSTFTDFCSQEWYFTCQLANACGPNLTGCANNWHVGYGCGVDCPLTFPGPTDHVVVPAGVSAALLNGSPSIYSLDVNRPFTLGNSITLAENAIFRYPLDWTLGTMAGSNATGDITIPATSSVVIETNNTKSVSSRTLILDGPAYWQDNGTLGLSNGAAIENNNLLVASGDATLSFFGGGACDFENNGIFRKNGGTGVTTIGVPFNSAGALQVLTGTLRLSTSGTATGLVSLSPNAALDFVNGNYTFGDGAEVIGDGLLNLNGILTLTAAVNVDHAVLTNQLAGAGDLNVVKSLDWSIGTMGGTGVSLIEPNAVLTITTNNTKSLSQRTLNNQGVMSWQDQGTLGLSNAAVLNNSGLLQASDDAALVFFGGGACVANNSGTLRKTGGSGATTIGVPFNSTGAIDVQSGTLRMSTSGTTTGPITLASGTAFDFVNGNYTFGSGASVTGAGLLNCNGILTLTGSVNVDNSTLTNQLNGPGDLHVVKALDWSLGSMNGGGTAYVDPNATLTIDSNNTKSLSVRTLQNNATTLWQDGGTIGLSNGASIVNNGLLRAEGDATLSFFGGPVCVFTNAGTFRKAVGTSVTTIGVPFNSGGTIDVQTGTVRLSTSGTTSGPITLASGAALDFVNGNYTFGAGAAVTGAGVMNMNGILSLTGGVSVDHATLTNQLYGPGNLNIVNSLDWSGGSMNNGGATVINPGATLSITSGNSKSLAARTLTNQGTTTWQDGGTIGLSSGAIFNNAGTLTLASDATMAFFGGPACSFTNSGTLTKSPTTGTSTIGLNSFTNTGLIDVQTGTLAISSFTQTGGTTHVATGAALSSQQSIVLGGGTLRGAGAVSGTLFNSGGRLQPGEGVGTLSISGAYQQTGGVLEIDLGGTAAGTGYDRLTVSGSAALSGELRIAPANGFVPGVGQQFTVLTAGSLSAAFGPVTGPGQYSVAYTPTSVIVTVTATPCLGDLNNDRTVNLADLAILLAHYGAQNVGYNLGDLDGDGDVDLSDLAILLGRYGQSCP